MGPLIVDSGQLIISERTDFFLVLTGQNVKHC